MLELSERLEYEFSNIRAEESYNRKIHLSNGTKKDLDRKGESTRVKCWIHQISGDRPIWRCRVFESKAPSEKFELVGAKNACFVCLKIGRVASRGTQ